MIDSAAASERDPSATLWPTYALRAWLGALLAQTQRAERDLKTRIEAHEKEIARLRTQAERAASVAQSLHEAIGVVDNHLGRKRDTEILKASHEQHGGEAREPAQANRGGKLRSPEPQ